MVDYEAVSWLLGIVIGDGHVDRYFVEISDARLENLLKVAEIIAALGFRAVITKDKRENRYRLYVNTKRFVGLLRCYGYINNTTVPLLAWRYPIAFTRGLFDAEGHIEYWRPRRMVRINLANKSLALMNFVKRILENISIRPYMRYDKKVYRLQIYRKADILTFIERIGFWYPTKVSRITQLVSSLYTVK